jgi:hypothetical protein
MQIDDKITEGYVILCHNKTEEHVFIVRTLGPAVECPKCGSTALSGDNGANGANGQDRTAASS